MQISTLQLGQMKGFVWSLTLGGVRAAAGKGSGRSVTAGNPALWVSLLGLAYPIYKSYLVLKTLYVKLLLEELLSNRGVPDYLISIIKHKITFK